MYLVPNFCQSIFQTLTIWKFGWDILTNVELVQPWEVFDRGEIRAHAFVLRLFLLHKEINSQRNKPHNVLCQLSYEVTSVDVRAFHLTMNDHPTINFRQFDC